MSGPSSANPFVGPRPIQLGEALYGRKREVRELFELLQARRIVVLHSPSGAGKSSLVHAGLLPRLREAKFDVWKPIRVNLDPSSFADLPASTNRYLLSALMSLEEELPEQHRRSPAELASLDFLTYLQTRPRRKSRAAQSVVLLFDQFEEVLSVGPREIAAKDEFFASVGRALDSGEYWALFIIREDYLAALAPYRDLLPTQLYNTYRLDLLGLDGAREAALKLAAEGGREFPGVDKLIRDLSIVQVQRADGSFAEEQGIHVEPVYLQVVCHRLWDAMPADERVIDERHIEAHAGISDSLAAYYADAVAEIAEGDVASERAIRDWVGDKLIIGGIRSQVRHEQGASAGLDNALIEGLLDVYLVRTEQRAGANWFELSHDRLVEPVERDNADWERDHLHPVQVQAKLWEDGGRTRGLLYPAEALPAALAWAEQNPRLITAREREYLDASEARWAELGRRRARQRRFTIALSILTVLALGFGAIAWKAKREAEIAEDAAITAQGLAEAASQKAEDQKQLAEAAKQKAEREKQNAEILQKQNERLMQQVFDAALQPYVGRLVDTGGVTGTLSFTNEDWVPLLEEGDEVLVAALVGSNYRVIVSADRTILGEVDRHQQSMFVEIATRWLLGDRPEREIAMVGQPSERSKLDALERSFEVLDYELVRLDSLANPEALDGVGLLIIDDKWAALDAAELATFHAFLERGGGVLAVAEGWTWREQAAEQAEGPTPPEVYPMNALLEPLGVRWTEETLSAEDIERHQIAVVRFENRWPGAVDIYEVGPAGKEELYTTLARGRDWGVRTTKAQSWVVRDSATDRELLTVAITKLEQTVRIEAPKPRPLPPRPDR